MTAPLSSYSTDEIVDEIRVRLNDGVVGWHGLLSTNQANHRDMWVDLRLWVADQKLRFPSNEMIWKVDGEMLRLVDERTQRGVFSVNTTFLGREANEDHAPKPYVAEAAE